MTSLATRLTAATLAVALAGMAAATVSAQAATGSYTQTQKTLIGHTFGTSFGDKITIVDSTLAGPKAATPYPSVTTHVSGLAGTVTDVVLTVNGFSHQAPRDTDLMLVGPQGQKALVMSDVGGATPVTDVDLVFSDSSTSYLNFDDTVTGGTHHPSNDSAGDVFPLPAPSADGAMSSLSVFNGTDPNGFWALYAVDDLATYAGKIEWWAVSITTTGGTYPSSLTVDGLGGAIADLDVELEIDHNRMNDIDMMLVGPQGQQVTLLSDAGGPNEVDAATFVLDDSAAGAVPDPVLPGTYRATDVDPLSATDGYLSPAPASDGNTLLSVFNGTDPNGTWRLFVMDDSTDYRGYVAQWSLRITTADPQAPSPSPSPSSAPTPGPTPTAGPAADLTAPRVSSIRPGSRATGVPRAAAIVAAFSEALDPASVTRATVYLRRLGSTRRVPAIVTWRPGSLRVVVDPRRRLRGHTTYTAVVTGSVTDLAGNRLDQKPAVAGLQPKVWRFTTR
jgi:subtilisin-like proprotein convertase family protein